jgi:aspartate carbamoyltransferase catalytic subunit
MTVKLNKKAVLSIKEYAREELEELMRRAALFKKELPQEVLRGKLMASCFFEPSTRTRFSFESAMKRLGGDVIGFASEKELSTQKGESLYDTMKVIGQMVDVIVLRHPLEGASRLASEATSTVVINAGDGANEHPTQTMLDLFTIQESQGSIDGLNIAFVGDVKYARTVHSLVHACTHFDVRLFFVCPPELSLSDELCNELRSHSIPFSFHTRIEEVISRADILYVTRMQKERFSDFELYERLKSRFTIDLELLEDAKENLRVLHPLPRVVEIAPEVDHSPHSYYFQQSENGLYMRAALLTWILEV